MSYLGLVFTLYVLIGHASFSILNPEHEDAGSVASAIGLAAFVGCCFLASLFVIAGWEAIIYLQMSRRLG